MGFMSLSLLSSLLVADLESSRAIHTYGGQGTNKRGAHGEDHAIIYSPGEGPYLLPGEKGIVKTAIRCEMKLPSDKLDPASRLNYAKLYTVEHNVKVAFIGYVARECQQQLIADYNDTHPSLTGPQGTLYTGSSPDATTTNAVGTASSYVYDPNLAAYSSSGPPGHAGESSSHSGPSSSSYDEVYRSAGVQDDGRRR